MDKTIFHRSLDIKNGNHSKGVFHLSILTTFDNEGFTNLDEVMNTDSYSTGLDWQDMERAYPTAGVFSGGDNQ